ncbi:MAG: 2-oxoglutarate oxidoreductase subunit KorB [Firmicutes bacterium]|nr:2-oxoglutarate oxidoreductase subunit KorB [candidate division NPL-UPA2 bacterium]
MTELSRKSYDRGYQPTWCTGCGDYGVLRAVQEALAALAIPPHLVAAVSGIGCSGRISGYLNAYTFHSAHGRALPVAEGIKRHNPELTVLALGGDGDGFAIGLGHTLHAARRNQDITYITMTNYLYGLTKGQLSPVSPQGFKARGTPHPSSHAGLNQALLLLATGAGFVAQASSGRLLELIELIRQGIAYPGFAYINVFSPCVTFNQVHTYAWANENLHTATHDSTDLTAAMVRVNESQGLLTGVLYRKQ